MSQSLVLLNYRWLRLLTNLATYLLLILRWDCALIRWLCSLICILLGNRRVRRQLQGSLILRQRTKIRLSKVLLISRLLYRRNILIEFKLLEFRDWFIGANLDERMIYRSRIGCCFGLNSLLLHLFHIFVYVFCIDIFHFGSRS